MSTDNLWNEVTEAANALLYQQSIRPDGDHQRGMDDLCAAVRRYGEATGQPGYYKWMDEPPADIWACLSREKRDALARFVLAEVDQGPAGVVDSKTVWMREMSAVQIFEAMNEEQRSDFDKMSRTHLIRSMSAGEAWEALSDEQREALGGGAVERHLAYRGDKFDDLKGITTVTGKIAEQEAKIHDLCSEQVRQQQRLLKLEEQAEKMARRVSCRLDKLEGEVEPLSNLDNKLGVLERLMESVDWAQIESAIPHLAATLDGLDKNHGHRLEVLEAAVNRLDVDVEETAVEGGIRILADRVARLEEEKAAGDKAHQQLSATANRLAEENGLMEAYLRSAVNSLPRETKEDLLKEWREDDEDDEPEHPLPELARKECLALEEEHRIMSGALEIEKRRAGRAEDHLKQVLGALPWQMVQEFAEEPPF